MLRRLTSLWARAWRTPRLRRGVLVGSLALITLVFAVALAAWTGACAGNTCPSIEGLDQYDPNQASKVYAADGRLITDLGLERRTVVPLAEMSPYVKAAFIATEDKRFYDHHGIDWLRVFGAVKANVFKLRFAEGFSTITMQLARNLWPEDISGRDKSLRRKLKEVKVALEIEKKYPKDKILELYLNQIDLGNRAYGVETASQRYFGKSVRDLNLAEAATLAAAANTVLGRRDRGIVGQPDSAGRLKLAVRRRVRKTQLSRQATAAHRPGSGQDRRRRSELALPEHRAC